MSDRESMPVISYAQGGFEKVPQSPRGLAVVDVVFGTWMMLVNAWIVSCALPGRAISVDPDSGTYVGIADRLLATEALLSLGGLILLARAAIFLLRGKTGNGIRWHWAYLRAKSVLVLWFALGTAWQQCEEQAPFPIDWGRVVISGLIGLACGLIHPVIAISLLRRASL
jgi:hypothetical protein